MSIIFIKVHKCASTTGKLIFENFAKASNLHPLNKIKPYHFDPIKHDPDKITAFDFSQRSFRRNISFDHTAYDIPFFEICMEKPFIFYTFIRDPLSRFLSACQSPAIGSFLTESIESTYQSSLRDFNCPVYSSYCDIPKPCRSNFMSYMLGFTSMNEITKKNLRERYQFIGISEMMSISKRIMLLELCNYQISDFYRKQLILHKNVKIRENKQKKVSKVSENFADLFKENNQLDYKLYDLAIELFIEKIQDVKKIILG